MADLGTLDYKTFTTADGRTVRAAEVEVQGQADLYGVQALTGQWVVEEEKIVDGVKVYSHYVIDEPEADWEGDWKKPAPEEIDAEERKMRAVVTELEAMPEAELIDKARLYGIEGKPGEPLKTGLIHQLANHLRKGGEVAKPGEVVFETREAEKIEPIDADAIAEQKAIHTPAELTAESEQAQAERDEAEAQAETPKRARKK